MGLFLIRTAKASPRNQQPVLRTLRAFAFDFPVNVVLALRQFINFVFVVFRLLGERTARQRLEKPAENRAVFSELVSRFEKSTPGRKQAVSGVTTSNGTRPELRKLKQKCRFAWNNFFSIFFADGEKVENFDKVG